LGLHLGENTLSAVLLQRSPAQLYPIFWSNVSQSTQTSQSPQFRLPTVLYLSRSPLHPTLSLPTLGDGSNSPATPSGFIPLAIGDLAKTLSILAPAPAGSGQRIVLDHLGQYLGQPDLVMDSALTAADMTFALQVFLSTLTPAADARHAVTSTVQCAALGLSSQQLQKVLQQISGVGVVCPHDWGGDQRQAMAQAILEAKLVGRADQIDFVDEAIAALLSTLKGPEEPIQVSTPGTPTILCNQNWAGNTLIVVRGGTMLHLAVVTLPENLHTLRRHQIHLEALPMVDRLQRMVEQLQQAIADLLREATLSSDQIHQVLYTDEVEPSPAIAQWLKNQFPAALHCWDSDRPAPQGVSRLAYGVAASALYDLG
jgi:hypothetical protein